MSFYSNQYYPQIDPATTQKIIDRLIKEPDLAQTLFGLYYKVMEGNPGERFTRYARKDFKEKQVEKPIEISNEKPAEKVIPVEGESKAQPAKDNIEKTIEGAKKKRSLQLSKNWDKAPEFIPEKKIEYVLDNHKKVIEKFKEMQNVIKPHSSLLSFKNMPILDLNKKPALEEIQVTRARMTSFNKAN